MVKDDFYYLILDMGCTEQFMLRKQDIVSDQAIIRRIDRMDNLERKDRDGRTLLINATAYGRSAVVQYLINIGADAHAKDSAGFTALHAAILSNDIKTINLLLEAGVDPNAVNEIGNTPLMICNLSTDLDVFRVLLLFGANPTIRNNFGVSAINKFSSSQAISDVLSQYR